MIKQSNNKRMILLISIVAIIIIVILFSNSKQEKEKTNLIRSSSLSKNITKDTGTERIDYVNEDGIITYAADKHYATIIITKGNDFEVEEYFDANGSPAKQTIGHYAIMKQYIDNGQNVRLIYLGADKQPIMTGAGYAEIHRSYNDKGDLLTEFYYDDKGYLVNTYSVGSGCKKLYNDKGKLITQIYLNSNGMITKTGLGYAIIKRTYYLEGVNSGRIKDEFYYDEYERPVKLPMGQYGIHKEYDEFGRIQSLTFLGLHGQPIVSSAGYSTYKQTFYEDDSVRTELYYDESGNPVALSEGQYGILYKNGSTEYLDINGNVQFNLKNFLLGNHTIVVIISCVLACLSALSSKRINAAFLFVYLGFVLYMTILYRENTGLKANFIPFWSYIQVLRNERLRWQIIENIVLFIPLGTVIYSLCPCKKAILILISISVLIEMLQFFFNTGFCETDDIISNSLGGLGGILIRKLTTKLKLRISQ